MIGLLSTRVGIDPGTANTLLYVKGRGIALNEPSLVTIRTSTGAIEAVGEEAEAGLGRTPRKFQIARPICAGAISDAGLFHGMLRRFLEKARVPGAMRRLQVAVSVPGAATEADRLSIVAAVQDAGARDVLLVEQVVAAANGAGVSANDGRGRLVVDIGAGVTELAVIYRGQPVYARSICVAGGEMDAAIASRIRDDHHLVIGELTAERLKIRIGSALPLRTQSRMTVKGRCMARGVPREATIRGSEVREALAAPVEKIVSAIREALEQAPPETRAGLAEAGVVLTGGGALLRNLDALISRDCGVPVRVASDPLSCVILGLARRIQGLRQRDWCGPDAFLRG